MSRGRFGVHGGQYMSETLMNELLNLEEKYNHFKEDPEFVEELNALRPISYDEDWGANSFTMVGDRYALVDIKVPDNLQMVLNMLTDISETRGPEPYRSS